MKEFDTIAAIATALGEGGIAIIRVSGNKALEIVNKIFRGINGKDLLDIAYRKKTDIEYKLRSSLDEKFDYNSLANCFKTSKTSPTNSGSKADVGSSNKMTSGFTAMARAIPIRCCWPPES